MRLERGAEHKHEYFDGAIQPVHESGYAHNLICANLTILHGQLSGKNGTAVGSSQRLQIMSGQAFTYPALAVVCGNPEFRAAEETDTLLNPTLLIEVTYASTTSYDYVDKFMLYRQVPSLQQYLMIDSTTVYAELYTRDELNRWVLTETRDPAAVLDLGSIGCAVPLAEVYAGVGF
ncbi:Uma2 family endonuclease [Hymenobacter sp. ASUV-10]|uniref:Uma2 family endonuclease n=1 Tax=Hymenobacter aranciens TaxID=3063996 RepID=A0ABT9B9T7_9BACT|nr:Uma2 family endonuclease [Hymenobacter sp. ASUV-10]MDO7875025.1 Uma2 family endonuclease [Hymenobacter sp. ASUV-10]